MKDPTHPSSFDPNWRARARHADDHNLALRRRVDTLSDRLKAFGERLDDLESLSARLEAVEVLTARLEALPERIGNLEERLHKLEKPERDARARQRLQHIYASRGW